jgi:3-methyl-2-oxobutanoate hydroxymethyltransferase
MSLFKRFTIADLRDARKSGRKVPMLTCYDYTTARLMHEAGVPSILAGDSAANVILGHPTTLPVSLDFMIEIAGAVRRGAPNSLLVGDMPFGSYQASEELALTNIFEMVKRSNCDAVKMEVSAGHAQLVRRATDAGVSVVAHIGLRPQAVGLMGGYKAQGRTAKDADEIVALALLLEKHGAAAILLEAVPEEVSGAVIKAIGIPVIGCGAGNVCHASVIVTHDALGLTPAAPKFVPKLADLATPYKQAFEQYIRAVESGEYPGKEHGYSMIEEEKKKFAVRD